MAAFGDGRVQDGGVQDGGILEGGEDAAGRVKLKKAPNAFRTISEVADDLHIPQHVLRFWETKFPQVKPMKRGGGRRAYVRTTSRCCSSTDSAVESRGYDHQEGVQRLLREGGGRLSGTSRPLPKKRRAAAEAEAQTIQDDQPDLLIPGLDLETEPAGTAPRPLARRRTDPEAERLRAVLIEVLAELEAIRALLD